MFKDCTKIFPNKLISEISDLIEKNISVNISNVKVIWLRYLNQEIKREPGEQNVGEKLNDVEDSKHHPVNQPLGIVFFGFTFHSFNTKQNTAENYVLVLP